VEQNFSELVMGRQTYSEYHTSWLKCMWHLEEVGVEIPGDESLYLKYLAKLTVDLRSDVLKRSYQWESDATGSIRPARTWVANWQVCEIVVNERTDTWEYEKFNEHWYALTPPSGSSSGPPRNEGGGPPGTCFYCQRLGRTKALCPKAAAERRNEVDSLIADSARTGGVCTICAAIGVQAKDHRARHHDFAAQDACGGGRGGGGTILPWIPGAGSKGGSSSGQNRKGNGSGKKGSHRIGGHPGGGKGSRTGSRAAAMDQRGPSRAPSQRRENRVQHCFSWRDTGRCDRGSECPYAHDPTQRNRRVARDQSRDRSARPKGRGRGKGDRGR
jgi:hypothetical protein